MAGISMNWEYKTLLLSKEVASSTTDVNTVTPSNGNEIVVINFSGHAAYSINSCVKAVWDYDTENEEIIWSTKGDTIEDIDFEVIGDGSKKLAVLLENGEDGPVVMSCKIKYWEKTS